MTPAKFLSLTLLLSLTCSCSDYLQTKTDELISKNLSHDIVFITAIASLQCNLSHLTYTEADGLAQLANNIEKTADEIKGFDESTIKVKISLFELAAIAKKAVPIMKKAEKMDLNPSYSADRVANALTALKAVNLERDADFAQKDLEKSMDKLKSAMLDYVKNLKLRTKTVVLDAKKSKLIVLSALFVDKNQIMRNATASFKNSLHQQYLKQNSNTENNIECFDNLMNRYVNNNLLGG